MTTITLVLEVILLLSAASVILLLVRSLPRTADLSEEEIARFSLKPRLERLLKELREFAQESWHSLSKKFLHSLAFFSKHTHRISTKSIAHIERKKSGNGDKQDSSLEEEGENH